MKVTLLGFGLNCSLATIQGLAGYYCHSAALTSDAVHTLSDSVSDIVALAAVRLMISQREKGGSAWPHGLGKVDPLAALGVSGMMLMSGGTALMYSAQLFGEAMGWAGVVCPDVSCGDHGHSHGHGHGHGHGHAHGAESLIQDGNISYLAVGACLVTMVGKEGLYRVTRRVAERLGSSVLMANAWHHRSDALSSLFVLAGLLGRTFVHGALDPISGAIVAAVVIRISLQIGKKAVVDLLDGQLPDGERESLRSSVKGMIQALESDPRWQGRGLTLSDLGGRRSGPEVELQVTLSLAKAGSQGWSEISARQVSSLEASILDQLKAGPCPGARDVRATLA